MHYQKALLEQAGITKPPGTCDEFRKAAIALNKPPDRYGFGIFGRQGAGDVRQLRRLAVFQRRRLVDFKTGEIFINDAKAVEALQFWPTW